MRRVIYIYELDAVGLLPHIEKGTTVAIEQSTATELSL